MKLLTSDTLPLSGLINPPSDPANDERAINCTAIEIHSCNQLHGGRELLSDHINTLVYESLSPNTRRAYASDLTQFSDWGGRLPSTPETIAEYLAAHCDTHSTATLIRWLTSLSKAHRALGGPDPAKHELVRSVLRGIRRTRGSAQKQAKPLLRDDLFAILDALGDNLKAVRDRALLLIGFAGGFRRSELVGLDVGDIEPVKQGIVITIRKSKTDQLGIGRKIGIPFARGRHCAVTALDTWRAKSGIIEGALFRPITRHGKMNPDRLSGEAVSLVIRDHLREIGIDPDHYSGHSLRAGFVTSAVQAGVSSWRIREQTGHKSESMLTRYIRDGELFLDNAAGALL